MRAIVLLSTILFLTGCFGPPKPQQVWGISGTAYSAPDICAALVACKKANEASCFYDRSLYTSASGTVEEGGCKEVSK